ncbi:hypothetical protein TIFTF001_023727 [Ficus carica]|uniref:Uncharacterized protein n=1 Tax=Ficus carica TaxID=3494 RepID=A0AA88AK55_FICCA|nr:hypothetical protein TIFTF001_023727 [Ficus carica]
MINRTWLDPGWDSGAPNQFRKGSLMLEGASPLSDRSASSRKSEEVITDKPHAQATCRVTCTCGSGQAFLRYLISWRTSPDYCPFILE